jgi:hypothetical protein
MSSSSPSIVSILTTASKQVTIYLGVPILIAGLIGNVCNIIVFLSLRTFRQNSCAFYLMIMSFVNIGQLLMGLTIRIIIYSFGIDWTLSSLFYCKFRNYSLQPCVLTSLTCMFLATIDQFFATCSFPRLQQWSSIKVAHRLTGGFTLFWILYAIPCLFYYTHTELPTTGGISCTVTHPTFQRYNTYVTMVVLEGILPFFITILFGSMAYRNTRRLAHRIVPLVRHELDKQLTAMVLVQVFCNVFTFGPFVVMSVVGLNTNTVENPVTVAQLKFANLISFTVFYLYFAVSIILF